MSRREVECESKTAYDTQSEAVFVRNRNVHDRGAAPSLRAYACRWGSHWHVGHAGTGTNGRAAPRRRRGHRRG